MEDADLLLRHYSQHHHAQDRRQRIMNTINMIKVHQYVDKTSLTQRECFSVVRHYRRADLLPLAFLKSANSPLVLTRVLLPYQKWAFF